MRSRSGVDNLSCVPRLRHCRMQAAAKTATVSALDAPSAHGCIGPVHRSMKTPARGASAPGPLRVHRPAKTSRTHPPQARTRGFVEVSGGVRPGGPTCNDCRLSHVSRPATPPCVLGRGTNVETFSTFSRRLGHSPRHTRSMSGCALGDLRRPDRVPSSHGSLSRTDWSSRCAQRRLSGACPRTQFEQIRNITWPESCIAADQKAHVGPR